MPEEKITMEDLLDIVGSILANDYTPSRFYTFLDGSYFCDEEDKWWHQDFPNPPFFWQYPTPEDWSTAQGKMPWIPCPEGPFCDRRNESRMGKSVERVRELNESLTEVEWPESSSR